MRRLSWSNGKITKTDTTYSAWIVIIGKIQRGQTREWTDKILTDPFHDALEQEGYDELSSGTRWRHFVWRIILLSSLTEDMVVKSRLIDLFRK